MQSRNFNAVSIDSLLFRHIKDQRFTARVHSVFRHAINIEADDLGLVTIVSPEKPHGPGFIKACPFHSLGKGLRVRSRAVITGKEVVFHAANARISLEDARQWRGRRGVRKLAGSDELLGGKALLDEALDPSRDNRAAVEKRIEELSRAIAAGDPARIEKGLGSLIGLGDGLTPAGDDFLLGLVCLISTIPSEARCAGLDGFLEIFSELIDACRDSTTFISYSFLKYGSEGRFVEPLSDLCRTILSEGKGSFRKSLDNLLGIGAESGRSMLRGVATGMELVLQG